jgi:hypothetical protein
LWSPLLLSKDERSTPKDKTNETGMYVCGGGEGVKTPPTKRNGRKKEKR